MSSTSQDPKALFLKAIETRPPEAWQAFLDDACGDNSGLRNQVETLLIAHAEQDSLFDMPPTLASETPDDAAGQTIGQYRLVRKVGEGGMGIVYLAQQERPLRREVALKIIRPDSDSQSVISRFEVERQTLASMDHPYIATALDAGATDDGRPFFVMEFVRGIPITKYCDEKKMTVKDRLILFESVCDAIQHAHHKGIIHRDIKPSNILVCEHDGKPIPKVIDFGVAKAVGHAMSGNTRLTGDWMVVGTPLYMSPEQAEPSNEDVDTRSDIYSLGALLYELLTSRTPVRLGSDDQTQIGILRGIIENDVIRPSYVIDDGAMHHVFDARRTSNRGLRRILRRDLDAIVLHALERDRRDRYQTASEFAADVQRHLRDRPIVARTPSILTITKKFFARNRTAVAIVSCLLVGLLGWGWNLELRHRRKVEQQVRDLEIPDIQRLINDGHLVPAYRRLNSAAEMSPDDPILEDIRTAFIAPTNIDTTPPGAEVSIRDWNSSDNWLFVGTTPLKNINLPRGYLRFRISLKGHNEVERLADVSRNKELLGLIKMSPESDKNRNMVLVSQGDGPRWLSLLKADRSKMIPEDYFIDKFEVSNEEYKDFLASKSYHNDGLWSELAADYPDDWRKKLGSFVDATNTAGPAGWINGSFELGKGKHPVTGVCWYEAEAFARSSGKQLPTIHHWGHAADFRNATRIVANSNFSGVTVARIGSNNGVGFFGVYDMAGNVKEWCLNRANESMRCVLGGSYDEPEYMFSDPHVEPALRRSPNIGFRCVRYSEPPPNEALNDVSSFLPDFDRKPRYDTEEFEALKSMYGYARPPESRGEVTDEGASEVGIHHIALRMNAAYDDDELLVNLFMPSTNAGKVPIIVFFPGRSANDFDHFDASRDNRYYVSALVRQGWAVAWPVYKGTFERRDDISVLEWRWNSPYKYKDLVTRWVKDVSRTIDYLETRSDLDLDSLTYFGGSLGGCMGPIMLSVEERFQAGVLAGAGLYMETGILPEVDTFNYAPHVKVPVLMFNGRYDVIFPLEASQKPLLALLGTADVEQRLIDSGHVIRDRESVAKEADDWLRSKLESIRHSKGLSSPEQPISPSNGTAQ